MIGTIAGGWALGSLIWVIVGILSNPDAPETSYSVISLLLATSTCFVLTVVGY